MRTLVSIVVFLAIIGLVGLAFYANNRRVGPDDSRTVVLCAGDSITADIYPEKLQELLRAGGFGDIWVVNAGRNGHTSGQYLAYMKDGRLWSGHFPGWLLLQLGTNDVRTDGDRTPTPEFKRNMAAIVGLFRTEAARRGKKLEIAIAKIPRVKVSRNFDEDSCRRVEHEINPAIEELAAELNLFLVDNHMVFDRHPDEIDEIHPTPAGYALLADNWYEFLKPRLLAKEAAS